MDTARRNPLRTAGYLWGPRRIRLGMSLRQLAELSGVNRATLSLAEAGRLIPAGKDYDAVVQALDSVEGKAS